MLPFANLLILFLFHFPYTGNDMDKLPIIGQTDPIAGPTEFVKVFPSGDYGRMSIQLGKGMEPQDSLSIRNVDGKSIFVVKGSQQIKNKITIDVVDWPNSVYHVFYYHHDQIYVAKLVKM